MVHLKYVPPPSGDHRAVALKVAVVILARDMAYFIASTILKIRGEFSEVDVSFTVVDNGSSDGTEWFAKKAGSKVIRYKKVMPRSVVVNKAVEVALKEDRGLYVLLDLMGGNSADDAISLLYAVMEKGDRFATGWISPKLGGDTIGCIALDRKNLEALSGRDVQEYLLGLLRSRELEMSRKTEDVLEHGKMKRNKDRFDPVGVFRLMRRKHPLKFYGGIGMALMLLSIGSGFYTVDYFYENQNLYYPSAFLTVALVMIGGFMMVAGMMLNALTVITDKVRSERRWRRSEIRRLE